MKYSFLIMILLFNFLPLYAADMALDLKAKGNKAHRENNYPAAIEYYRQSLQYSENPIVRRNLGISAFHNRDYELAKESFTQVLKILPDAKTFFWNGRLRLAQNRAVEAIFFFRASLALTEDVATQKWLEQSLALWKSKITLVATFDIDDFYQAEKLLKSLLGNDYDRLLNRYMSESGSKERRNLEFLIDNNFKKAGYSYLPLVENPAEIAEFIGRGTKITTVCVQTLPFLFAETFDTVEVVDISQEQLKFHTRLFEATHSASQGLKQFITQTQREFTLMVGKTYKNAQPFETSIAELFQEAYGPLEGITPRRTITTIHQDIFNQNPAPGEWIFISTIPGCYGIHWPTIYPTIRRWLEEGVKVAFTLLIASLNGESLQELTACFDDVAEITHKPSENSFGAVYFKMKPCRK